ncbi:MAG TPA: hypothetical protein VFX83_07940, partial [Azonexus sp.]|nr:hypothetical protein [Azonexus sp.]
MTSARTNTTEHLLQSHQRAQLFAIIGVPLLSFFGLVALSNREWPLLLLIATSLLTICGSYLAIERGRASPVTLWMAIVSFTVLLIYLVAFSGQEHGRALWFFALLLLAGMMLPPRQGATWAGISIATAAAIMLLGGPEFGTSAYSTSFTIRFVITAILISVGIFWSEKTLLRYKEEAAAQKAAT